MRLGGPFILQLLVAFIEMWLCYQMLFYTVLDKKHLFLRDKILIWCSSIIVAVGLAANRQISFFSSLMFIVVTVIISGCIWIINRKEIIMIFCLIFIFNSLIALMDFFFAFLSMQILKYKFAQEVYVYPESWWPMAIFILSRLITTIVFCVIKKALGKEKVVIELKGDLLVVCLVLGIILRRYQLNMHRIVNGETMLKSEEMSLSLLGIIVIVACGLVLFLKSKIIQKENKFLMMKDELLMQKYLEVENKIEENRCMVHDMKHNLLVLQEYVTSKDYEKLEECLGEMNNCFHQEQRSIWTQNKIWDMVLSYKRNEAEQKGIKFVIDSVLVPSFPFDDREGCSLFGNLLDNAIEACEKIDFGEKFINVKIEKQQQLLFLEIANSIKEEPQFQNNKLVTTKSEKSLHGYGLKSVKRIIDKYEGIISYQAKDRAFVVKLTFFDMGSEKGM